MSVPTRRPWVWRPREQADPIKPTLYATSSHHGSLMAPSRRRELVVAATPLSGACWSTSTCVASHNELRETKRTACIYSLGSTNRESQGKITPRCLHPRSHKFVVFLHALILHQRRQSRSPASSSGRGRIGTWIGWE
jgi:hypothetical protein